MTVTLIVYMLFLHFIADFVLQSRKMGKEKSNSFGYLFGHIMIQFGVMFIGLLFKLNMLQAYQISGLNALIHGIIDWNIWKLYKRRVIQKVKNSDLFAHDMYGLTKHGENILSQYEYWNDHGFYLTIGFDQFLHSATILLVVYLIL